jgi:hypothetical protein
MQKSQGQQTPRDICALIIKSVSQTFSLQIKNLKIINDWRALKNLRRTKSRVVSF